MPISYRDIKQVPISNYQINVPWGSLEQWLNEQMGYTKVELEPDFQRHHVWTIEQRQTYMESMLSGVETGQDIYWNQPRWPLGTEPLVLVDGLQRLTTVRMFMRDEVYTVMLFA